IGLGAVGSNVAVGLAGAGVGQLRVVDPDNVDLSNLHRQFLYTTADLGRPKVTVTRERIRQQNPDVGVEELQAAIGGEDDIRSIIDGCDLLINNADTPRRLLRRWINRECVRAGVPFIQAGYSEHM